MLALVMRCACVAEERDRLERLMLSVVLDTAYRDEAVGRIWQRDCG